MKSRAYPTRNYLAQRVAGFAPALDSVGTIYDIIDSLGQLHATRTKLRTNPHTHRNMKRASVIEDCKGSLVPRVRVPTAFSLDRRGRCHQQFRQNSTTRNAYVDSACLSRTTVRLRSARCSLFTAFSCSGGRNLPRASSTKTCSAVSLSLS